MGERISRTTRERGVEGGRQLIAECRLQEQTLWRREVGTKNSLRGYPKVNLAKRETYVGRGVLAATMAKFRLGCLDEMVGKSGEGGECGGCGEPFDDIRLHILTKCQGLGEPEGSWRDFCEAGRSRGEVLAMILGDTCVVNVRKVWGRYKLWKEITNT